MTIFRREWDACPAASPSGSELPDLGPAPELFGVHPWLNTRGAEPVTLARLSGRVVLIEFWTFACGNRQRTLPFLRRMHSRYRPRLAVLGVHTPELPHERPARNVERAAREQALSFTIGLDNDNTAGDALGNWYWPSLYLIDAAGHVRYAHVGEGGHHRTEATIRASLAEPAEPNPPTLRS